MAGGSKNLWLMNSDLFMRGPLQSHSQVGSLQRGVLKRLRRTPKLQSQLQPKLIFAVKFPNLKGYRQVRPCEVCRTFFFCHR